MHLIVIEKELVLLRGTNMIDEKKLIKRMKKCGIEFMSHWYTNQEIINIFIDLVEEQAEEELENRE